MSFRKAIAVLSIAVIFAPAVPAGAAERASVVEAADLDRALLVQGGGDDDARQVLRDLLARPEVAELAGDLGLELRRAEDAVETLEGEELRNLAAQVRQVEGDRAGGQTITISLVTLLLVIIIVILLAD
jgi:cytochrome c-type biogenesis protein CcmH/NrfG